MVGTTEVADEVGVLVTRKLVLVLEVVDDLAKRVSNKSNCRKVARNGIRGLQDR